METLPTGGSAVFHAARQPATGIRVRRAEGAARSWDGVTSDIDFQLESGAPAVASGTVGWLELPDRPREALTIPSAAVLQSAEGPYVLVLQPDRASAFTRRPIQLGRTSSGQSVVQAGLLPGERVVVRSAFFLDAEGRLGPGSGAAGR